RFRIGQHVYQEAGGWKESSPRGVPGTIGIPSFPRFRRWNPLQDRTFTQGDERRDYGRAPCLQGSGRGEGGIATGSARHRWNPLVSVVPTLESASGPHIPSQRYTDSLE